jgi:uncharacterized protein with von Willebrand factor type A (vWA) domain
MGFEKIVLDKVAKVLKQERMAYFRNGTLFVLASEPEARQVFSKLFRDYYGKVEVSLVGHEYAFDFVA